MSTTISKAGEKINIEAIFAKNVPLASYSSFACGGNADLFFAPADVLQLQSAVAWARSHTVELTILAGGTNVLISDKGVEGLVISTNRLNHNHVRGTLFCCEAGLSMDSAINNAIEHSLSGLEPLGGLPGSVGGAVWGNAAVHELAIAQLIEWVDYLDEQALMQRLWAVDGGFGYKHSPFKGTKAVIVEIAFRLIANSNTSQARLSKEASRQKRIDAGQFEYPSAGCMFKNPSASLSAGALIDQAQMKGASIGGAYVSSSHANFIINAQHTATSSDIFALSELVKERVQQHSGITLDREIVLIGRW